MGMQVFHFSKTKGDFKGDAMRQIDGRRDYGYIKIECSHPWDWSQNLTGNRYL